MIAGLAEYGLADLQHRDRDHPRSGAEAAARAADPRHSRRRSNEAKRFLDNDTITDDPVPIKVKVTIAGDEMTVDFTEISAPAP